jgi:hypothetical protein
MLEQMLHELLSPVRKVAMATIEMAGKDVSGEMRLDAVISRATHLLCSPRRDFLYPGRGDGHAHRQSDRD